MIRKAHRAVCHGLSLAVVCGYCETRKKDRDPGFLGLFAVAPRAGTTQAYNLFGWLIG
jgi:hypothetical protein